MKQQHVITALIAIVISVATFGTLELLRDDTKKVQIQHMDSAPAYSTSYSKDNNGAFLPFDFTETAEKVIDAVVFIKSTQLGPSSNTRSFDQRQMPDLFKEFFGDRFQMAPQQPQQRQQRNPSRVGSGSGVIISDDGYIVTNNHVIDNADDIEVTLHDNRTYKAVLVGTDPTTDLAVLQIKEKNLPATAFVDSDDVKIGEWVLAVGNPFGLNSTVTAGIVSAKGRNININREQYAVENFIQTDAAINPGNSGGALVNIRGGLIGINTAIASPTGAYSGYGFAVPANITKKVISDIIEYGVVQRGVLGVTIRSVDGNFAKTEKLDTNTGVYVDSLMTGSAAAAAGVQSGDVIVKVNDIDVKTASELQGMIARHRPGDLVTLTVNRKGSEKSIDVILNNKDGNTEYASKTSSELSRNLGVVLSDIDKSLAKRLDIHGGIRVSEIRGGQIRRQTSMQDGFIITHVDGKKVYNIKDLENALEGRDGGVMVEGIYEDIPGTYYYAFGL